MPARPLGKEDPRPGLPTKTSDRSLEELENALLGMADEMTVLCRLSEVRLVNE